MPIDASPSGTLDIENATLRSREIVALTSMVAGNDVVRSSGPPTLEVYGDPSYGVIEPRLELVSNTNDTNSNSFTRLTSNVGVFSIKTGTDASDNGTITFGGFANERLRITSGGRIGIGRTDPQGPLHVYGDGNETNAPLRIESADRYSGLICHDDGGAIQLGADGGTLRILTGYAADLSGGTEVARISSNQLYLKSTRNSQIFIEDSGTDNGTYYQGLYIGSPISTTDAGMRMVVSHDGNTTGDRRNIIGFTTKNLEFNNFSDNSTTTGFGTTRMVIESAGNVGIGTDNPSFTLDVKHNTNANPGCIARLLGSNSTGIRFHTGTGGTSSNWTSTGINLSGTSGGGAIFFVFTMNNSNADSTGAAFYFIRKAYDQAYWASDSTSVTKIAGGNGGGSSESVSFRRSNSILEYQVSDAGNGVFYAIEFDQ